MEFDNSFDVPLVPQEAWNVLMDIPRIARCMPGAELTEAIDAQNFRGKISVRLGPVALAFAGRVQIEDLDEANHSAQVKAQGNDAKGRGAANAAARFHIEPAGAGSRVMIHTNLTLSGAVAQYGRGVGIIQGTAAQIIGQFAANLRKQLAEQPPPQQAAASGAAPRQAAEPPAAEPPAAAAPAASGAAPREAAREPVARSPAPRAPAPGAPASAAAPREAAKAPAPAAPAAAASAAVPREDASGAPAPPASGAAPREAARPGVAASPAPQAEAARPISGLSLIGRVLWQQIRALFGARPS